MFNNQLNQYIRNLSQDDKKSIIEKCLKTTEEVGELARKVLPYGSAHGTNHRFTDPNSIVEEIADVILTVLSIGYDVGMTEETLESVVLQKAQCWQQRQLAEENIDFKKIPFEIHITVESANVEHFCQTCHRIGVKPILLDLYLPNSVVTDMQTSSIFVGDNAEVYGEMNRISEELQTAGYSVIRQKIETVPWHPMAPARYLIKNNQKIDIIPEMTMPSGCYFECHFGVICSKDSLNQLRNVAESHGARMSKNAFKKINDNEFIMMITLRQYNGFREDFEIIKSSLADDLQSCWAIDKIITEFSIYDTMVQHDKNWINASIN